MVIVIGPGVIAKKVPVTGVERKGGCWWDVQGAQEGMEQAWEALTRLLRL